MKKNIKSEQKTDFVFKRKLHLHIANFKLWSKWTILLIVAIVCFKNYDNAIRYVKDLIIETSAEAGFKLNNIVIEGQENLSVKDVLSQFNADNNTPIFLINLSDTKKILEENDWVKHVAVMRKLPNTISIRIFERKPIAIWQYNKNLFLIDDEGYAIKHDVSDFTNLPHFVGEGANLYAADILQKITNLPTLTSHLRSIVRIGNRRWDFVLKSGATIKMPEKKFDSALEALEKKYLQTLLEMPNIKVFDMRDESKYYIEQN
jgi:cell division protein FtsQ